MRNEVSDDLLVVTAEELHHLIDTYTERQLVELGCLVWTRFIDDPIGNDYMAPGDIHFLIPVSWYDFMPDDFPTVLMDGTHVPWSKAKEIQGDLPCVPAFGFIKNLQDK